MRPSILAIFPQAPWPARHDGISVRFYPLLQEIAAHADVDLLVLGDFRPELPGDQLLERMHKVATHRFSRAGRPRGLQGWWQVLRLALPWSAPFKYSRYNITDVVAVVRSTLNSGSYDVIWWIGVEFAEALVELDLDLGESKLVLDLVDSPTLNYSRLPPPAGVRGWHHKYDVWKTRRFERRLRQYAGQSVYISIPDAEAVLEAGEPQCAEIIPNGVYTQDASPSEQTTAPRKSTGPCIGFLGHMAYGPNVSAAITLHDRILVPLRKDFPDLELVIIGREPDASIRALAGPFVTVTGEVESIWPFVSAVDIFVFPLFAGSGLQNKILEAMFAVKPVVTSDICRAAIGARGSVPVLCGRTVEEILGHLRHLLEHPAESQQLGRAAREFVTRTFDWTSIAARYRNLLLGGEGRPST